MQQEPAELKELRAACKHLLVLSTMFLLDEDNQVRQKIITCPANAWNKWRGEQNTTLRSVNSTLP